MTDLSRYDVNALKPDYNLGGGTLFDAAGGFNLGAAASQYTPTAVTINADGSLSSGPAVRMPGSQPKWLIPALVLFALWFFFLRR